MIVGILSRFPQSPCTQSLVRAGTDRGHTMVVVDHLKCHMNIASHQPKIFRGDEDLSHLEAIIPRLGDRHTFFGTAVVRQFEMMGVYSVNESVAISRSLDRLRSFQLLARRGLGLPVTSFAHDIEATQHLIQTCGGAPLVIKLLGEQSGKSGVVVAETAKAAESVIEAFRGLDANILVQEYLGKSAVAGIHALVVGDRVVAAVELPHLSGSPPNPKVRESDLKPIRITPEERSTAARAAGIMGLNVAGVDLIRSTHGPVVIGVDASPSLDRVAHATGKDVASQILEFIERNAQSGKTRTRGKG